MKHLLTHREPQHGLPPPVVRVREDVGLTRVVRFEYSVCHPELRRAVDQPLVPISAIISKKHDCMKLCEHPSIWWVSIRLIQLHPLDKLLMDPYADKQTRQFARRGTILVERYDTIGASKSTRTVSPK